MLPTITGLSKSSIGGSLSAANDQQKEQIIANLVDDLTEVKKSANDQVDAYRMTMDRIMDRHNGHNKRYRDNKGRFVKLSDLAANDEVDAYEQTMDRIMGRHNGDFDAPLPSAANDNLTRAEMDQLRQEEAEEERKKRRAIHEAVPVRESYRRPRREPSEVTRVRAPEAVEDEEEAPVNRLLNESHENIESVESTDALNPERVGETPAESVEPASVPGLLESIEENTRRSADTLDDLVNAIKAMNDDQGIDSLERREKSIERASSSRNSALSEAQRRAREGQGQNNGGSNGQDRESIAGAIAAITVGGIGSLLSSLAGGQVEDPSTTTPGGGFSGQQQAPQGRATNRGRRSAGRGAAGGHGEMAGAGQGYRPATSIPTPVRGDIAFQREVTNVAREHNMAEDDLYRVMWFEGHLNPRQRNLAGSSGTGLIQFMTHGRTWATQHGYTRERLERMSRAEQMRVVGEYMRDPANRLNRVRNPTINDAYLSVFSPGFVGRSEGTVMYARGTTAYRQNAGFDTNRDGQITVGEATQTVRDADVPGVGRYRAPQRGAAIMQQSMQQSGGPSGGPTNTINQTNNVNVHGQGTVERRSMPATGINMNLVDVMREYFGWN